MNHTLEIAYDHYKQLYNMMLSSTNNIKTIQELLEKLELLYKNFQEQIEGIAKQFHEEISKDQVENDILVIYYQNLSAFLLKLSQNYKNLSKSISSEINDPFSLFVQNYRQNNRSRVKEIINVLNQYEDERVKLQQSQDNYYKIMAKASQQQLDLKKVLDQMENGQKSEKDIENYQKQTTKLKQQAQQSETEYKKQIQSLNQFQDKFKVQYKHFFEQFDINEQSRIIFTKTTIYNIIKYQTQFAVNFAHSDLFDEQKFKQLDDLYKDYIKIDTYKQIANSENDADFLSQIQTQQFVSFEQHQKLHSTANLLEKPVKLLDGQQLYEESKVVLDKLISDIFDDSKQSIGLTIKIDQQQQPQLAQQGQDVHQIQLEKQEQEQTQSQVKTATTNVGSNYQINTQFKKQLEEILQLGNARLYFLQELNKLILQKESYYTRLADLKFNELAEVLVIIIDIMEQFNQFVPECQLLLLQINNRVIKKKNNIQKTYLSEKLNQSKIWFSKENWLQLFEHIKSKKKKESILKQINDYQGQYGLLQTGIKTGIKGLQLIGKGIGVGFGMIKGFTGLFQKTQQQEQEEANKQRNEEIQINYYILDYLNGLLLNMEFNTEYIVELVVQLANEKGIEQQMIAKLLEKQQNQTCRLLRKQLNSSKLKKKKCEEKYVQVQKVKNGKLLFVIRKCLNYLSSDDKIESLLYVSRDFNKMLEKSVYKILLFNDFETKHLLEKKRVKIWQCLMRTHLIKQDYQSLKEEVNKNKVKDRIDEVIQLDVVRSLHIHGDKANQQQITDILRTFAYYNKAISYCQGMNYVAGYLLVTIQNESDAYKLFHIVMNKYFSNILTDSFHQLKVMFYQFDKCLNIFLSEIHQKFNDENIDPSYFSTSWFITIFTSVYQYSLKSHVVNVFWDIFLIDGWKGFFKCCMWLIKIHQEQIKQMEFDQILHFLGDLIKSDLFQLSEEELISKKVYVNADKIKQEINQFKITNSFLRNLEQEYDLFQKNVFQKIQSHSKKM